MILLILSDLSHARFNNVTILFQSCFVSLVTLLTVRVFIIHNLLQLLDCFGSLMDRPRIHADFEHKYPVLLSMFEDDLDTAKIIFDQQQTYESNEETLPINKNKPPISGCLKWAQELRERIKTPMGNLKLSLNHG